jgi:pyruvate/2-oxoglutarate dehydrogenase complex dihydrolipoamide acyltransferase (E2) component
LSKETTKVNFSKSGMGIEEGTIVKWLKNPGESVNAGEVLAEIETAKAIQEILAPVSGTLRELLAPEGATVMVNATLALIENAS